ncbi:MULTISPECIES: hypothetical protein [unclassified Granulicatella]|uniref:hypothetical protein n=1 Tax=unclassified Granulicatella TaxID=2630493 RepID=UPI00066BB3B0|nr:MULTISPECIES: hypothetical protein [unclassified Granulicatella]
MSLKINNLIESLKEKYGELEVDGEYGEQCKPGDFLEKLLETLYSFTFPSREWESSKRVLDAKEEEEIWTKWKCR